MKLFVYNLREFDERKYFDEFAEEFGITYDSTDKVPTLETAHLAEGCDYISIITTPIDAELMKVYADMGIKMISTRSIGVDHIDVEAAARYGIKVSNSIYAPNAVSDYAVMLMLMVNRHMKRIMQRADVQDYTLKGICGCNMNTQTVGVIGTGRIGREVIRSLYGFGCRLLAYDLYESEEVKEYAEYVPLETLYKECDIITLHMPLTEDNFHMIDENAIAM
ncbi:MAG: lactate dehydrogenase, partial [Lachnospiraceae bacterium]|nr:lactate dehydrogenase [Candidatus Equihabitans merdae]